MNSVDDVELLFWKCSLCKCFIIGLLVNQKERNVNTYINIFLTSKILVYYFNMIMLKCAKILWWLERRWWIKVWNGKNRRKHIFFTTSTCIAQEQLHVLENDSYQILLLFLQNIPPNQTRLGSRTFLHYTYLSTKLFCYVSFHQYFIIFILFIV